MGYGTPTRIYTPGPMQLAVQPGENIGLYREKEMRWFNLLYAEPLPGGSSTLPPIVDFVTATGGAGWAGGNIAANTVSAAARQMIEMEAKADEVIQWRFELLDDIEVLVNQPAALARYQNRLNGGRRHDLFSQQRDPDMRTTELWNFEDDTTWLTPVNPTATALTMARIRLHGNRYVLDKLDEEPDRWTFIPAWGYVGPTRKIQPTPIERAARALEIQPGALQRALQTAGLTRAPRATSMQQRREEY